MVRQATSLFSLFQGDEVYVLNQRQHKPACSSSLETLTHSTRDIFAALCPTCSAFFVFYGREGRTGCASLHSAMKVGL